MTEERKEITLDELAKMRANNADMSQVQVSGIVTIKDKDGNIKAELPIVSIEANPVIPIETNQES